MTVAAANVGWLPHFLGFVGRVGFTTDVDEDPAAHPEETDSRKSSESDAPINAMILSALLSTLYILFGNFRALLTFNGLGEYSFFFLTVLGAIVLRIREPQLRRPCKPFILVPVVFAVVSGFVIARGAVFAPISALVLLLVWILGIVYYLVQRRRFGVVGS